MMKHSGEDEVLALNIIYEEIGERSSLILTPKHYVYV
jgi:hypothetical protein